MCKEYRRRGREREREREREKEGEGEGQGEREGEGLSFGDLGFQGLRYGFRGSRFKVGGLAGITYDS